MFFSIIRTFSEEGLGYYEWEGLMSLIAYACDTTGTEAWDLQACELEMTKACDSREMRKTWQVRIQDASSIVCTLTFAELSRGYGRETWLTV